VNLDPGTALAAIGLANRAPSVHNSQPWRWRIGPSTIHLFADPGRALPGTDPAGRDLRISCGAALHHLRVALLAAGLGTRVHRLPDPAHPTHLAALEVHRAEPTSDVLALAGAIERRRSDRRVFSTWPVPEEHRSEIVHAAADEGADLHLVVSARELRTLAFLAEHAAVQQALLPEAVQETAAWTGHRRGSESGVPAANVPAAPAGTIPVRHMAAAEQAQSPLGRGESDGTVVALLATATDSAAHQVRAGEALSAVLLTATRLGLATDPISQPLELEDTRAELRRVCLGNRAEPHVLVRLGWAPVSAAPVPTTGRRPVADTVDAYDAAWP
jgi:nitroreductase